MNLEFNLAINDAYKPLLTDYNRYIVLYGGAGSGKSHFIAQKLLLRVLRAIKGNYREKFLALRKTQPAVKRSVFTLFQSYLSKWGWGNIVRPNLSDLSFTFVGGSQILCMGLDDPEKLKSIEGVTSIWLEEATEFTEADFTQCDLRLRGDTPSYKQIILSFNPIDALLWLNERFFLPNGEPKQADDTTIIRTTWRDNRFIDAEYVAVLEKLREQDKTLYEIYNLGIWGVLTNLIYSNYDEVTAEDYPDSFDEVIYGLDFGFNSPTALIEIGIKDEEIYERELIYESGLKNPDRIARFEELGIIKLSYIFADPSEPEFIAEISEAGYNIQEADNSVKPGIDFVKRKRTHIHEGSENILKEKKTYKWKEDKHGNVLDEPVKAFDHLMDAERYALYTYFKGLDEADIWFV